jgi:hypothetical protein
LVLLVVAAWAAASLLGPKSQYEIRVLDGSKVLATYSIDKLEALGVEKIVVLGKEEQGPSLMRVLQASGVESFQKVTIRGAGVRDGGVIVLTPAEASNDVIFDVANRGTVKVVGPDIEWGDRVRDVTDVVVEGAKG